MLKKEGCVTVNGIPNACWKSPMTSPACLGVMRHRGLHNAATMLTEEDHGRKAADPQP